ncbi:MAG TPA: hypothetical protein VLX92_05360 [Kofleriaceae bacterium]|nr:hypothetical protein [Kofleriaceae bacterium]
MRVAIVLAVLCTARAVHADDPPPDAGVPMGDAAPPADASPDAAPPPVDAGPTMEDLAARVDELEYQQKRLAAQLARKASEAHKAIDALAALGRFLTAFVDVGGYAVGGDGSGIRSDIGHLYYPKYAGRLAGQWVFMGDPLSTTINSLGEPADTSDSRSVPVDNLKSGNNPSLIVNSLGLAIGKNVGHHISISALAELLPRPTGTIVDLEYAHIDLRPTEDENLVIEAGKIDSVLGVEYRSQDAPNRLGVTPSLICRYTCGRPFGVEARWVHGGLTATGSITDGDNFDERFEPSVTVHASSLPTGAGHLQWTFPVGQGLELGVSGAIGPQADQPDLAVVQWHVGFDARLSDLDGWNAVAEYVQGLQPGKTTTITPCNAAPCLDYKGAYLLVDRRVTSWFTPYVRLDWRDAVHQNGVVFVYESHVARATLGVHFELTSRILAKAEYTFNRELGNIPQFPDDIVTTSIVVATD